MSVELSRAQSEFDESWISCRFREETLHCERDNLRDEAGGKHFRRYITIAVDLGGEWRDGLTCASFVFLLCFSKAELLLKIKLVGLDLRGSKGFEAIEANREWIIAEERSARSCLSI